ncbi:hypothetical protein JOD25_003069 [Kurthia huakuii]|nr:hypothetical protein [Kurthia huakuii]
MQMLTIRRFTENDTAAILALFYDTVHHVNAAHYTPAQLDVWAPSLDAKQLAQWQHSLMQHDTFVATALLALVMLQQMAI